MANTPILQLKNITKSYPGVLALDNASIEVLPGEVHALIGENGAGKSTLIKVITGAIEPDSGKIVFENTEYSFLTPSISLNIGISAIYQELNLAPSLSVMENIFMNKRFNNGILLDKRLLYKKTDELLNKLNVALDPNAIVKYLTVAYAQLVEIAKAIASESKLIIMDEPTAPLTDEEVNVLMNIILELKSHGVTILFISHRLEELFRIADRVTIMRDGKVIVTKNISDLTKDQMIYHMVGRELGMNFPSREIHHGKIALEVKDLVRYGYPPISFKVHYGEIIGLAGLVGSGRTEIIRLIFGADKKAGGEILVNGKTALLHSPKDAIKLGIGLVPEDRKRQGTLLNMSITHNIVLPILRKISKFLILSPKKEKNTTDKQIADLQIKTPSPRQLVQNLSGGNQQKVVLAKWLSSDVDILILDEPTRGIDVGAKQEFYSIISSLAAAGKAIIVISSEMQELIGLTERLLIMFEGKFMKELTRKEYDQELILQYASGEGSLNDQ